MNVATWKEGSPLATHMVEPTVLPIENTPAIAAVQYDHWTGETINHSNEA